MEKKFGFISFLGLSCNRLPSFSGFWGRGSVVGIFGEGGIHREGQVIPVFAVLAKRYNVPVLPVKIEPGRIIFGKPVFIKKVGDWEVQAKNVMNIIYDL